MQTTTADHTAPKSIMDSASFDGRSIARIAHPTDLSNESESAYYHALRLALACGSGLDLVHVDPEAHTVGDEHFPTPETTLEEWGIETTSALGEVQQIAAYGKEPVQPIVAYLDEMMPDLLVLATHRRQGLARWMRREVAGKVARKRALPTLFVPVGEEGFVSPTTGRVSLRRILVPVDWDPIAQPAVDTLLELAGALGASPLELTLLHIGRSGSEIPAIDLPKRDDLAVEHLVLQGDVAEQIALQSAEGDADLVVMVTAGRHGVLDALRGSTTEQVLQQIHCPLLVLPNTMPQGISSMV